MVYRIFVALPEEELKCKMWAGALEGAKESLFHGFEDGTQLPIALVDSSGDKSDIYPIAKSNKTAASQDRASVYKAMGWREDDGHTRFWKTAFSF